MTKKKRNHKQAGIEVKIFPVPFALNEIKEDITINTNSYNKLSQEQIINQAFNFHAQGNTQEAAKLYQYFINQGFNDYRVFSNYGILLKNQGKLEQAEIYYRKAIELKPDFAEAYSNLGIVLQDLGKLEEAEQSLCKAIKLRPRFRSAIRNLLLLNLNKTINSGNWDTSKQLLVELINNYPESRNRDISDFFKYWFFYCKRLVDNRDAEKLLPIFINFIIVGERNKYINYLTKYIFDNFNFNDLLELVGTKDKIILTQSYCEYKFLREEFSEAEKLASENIKSTEILINCRKDEDLGWLIIRRSLRLFQKKTIGREHLQNLVNKITS
ncbi:hypothetical protein DNJ72_06915 [Prochlorococcus marinus XMU1403]|uniref:tetratricopeptide repeat protein n=1 Tax=Prochlorococcus marinus TaxID=1219 RepID=UPI000D8DC816|nr:tetratricopeptide repeat protein [Prochlorococcus marinus]MBW3049874.1 hypothetical protein [Prochlorococcus marinus str. MU1403]PYE00788.1 hypothetical protein DNJ72_06915 [Prochlorococcus marinus XMU1403]